MFTRAFSRQKKYPIDPYPGGRTYSGLIRVGLLTTYVVLVGTCSTNKISRLYRLQADSEPNVTSSECSNRASTDNFRPASHTPPHLPSPAHVLLDAEPHLFSPHSPSFVLRKKLNFILAVYLFQTLKLKTLLSTRIWCNASLSSSSFTFDTFF